MTRLPDKEIMEMVEAIVEVTAPEQVILFGSQVTGRPGPSSDVDFLVIAGSPHGSQYSHREETLRIERALSRFSHTKDVLLISRDEAEYWRDSLNNVIARALRTGKTVYERCETPSR